MRDLTQGPIPGHLLTLVCQARPDQLVRGFADEPAVIEVAPHFLRLIS